ncbi:MAG: hypothetical protein FWH56_03905 [Betaproteobacteria bacterium]|nr:hypothetical protein [Betaproteobacteria bacterium]
MSLKLDTIVRYCLSRRKNGIGMALAGAAALLLSGCWSTLFDSPPGKVSAQEEAALQHIEKLASTTPESVMDKATEFGTAKAKNAADAARERAAGTMKRKKTDGSESEEELEEDEVVEWETPRLSFERVKADMPQLMVLGLNEATFLLNDVQIEPGKMTQEGRIVLIGPGRHYLQVKCPFDPPFSANFYVVKDDRVVLSGRCTSGRRVMADEKKRN